MDTKSLADLAIPRWEQLPDLDLYMDQVLSYINGKLEPLALGDEKAILTSSMVNNYVKTNIVKPPVKKHYKRYHMAYLIVVMLMKRCYSLSEISQLIQVYSNIEDPDRVSHDYNKFISIFESCLKEMLETGCCTAAFMDNPSPEQLLMINVIRTLCCKIWVQNLLKEEKRLPPEDR